MIMSKPLPGCEAFVLGRLILLFVFLPLAELVLLLVLADRLSWQFTLGLVVLTGILGASLARWQGWRTYLRIQDELAAAQIPTEPLPGRWDDSGRRCPAADAGNHYRCVWLFSPDSLPVAVGIATFWPAGCGGSFHLETYRSPDRVETLGEDGAAATESSTGGDRIIDAHVVHREPRD